MSSILCHHGIRGQRWGKRNGPPYPLDPSDHSVREKRLNSRFTGSTSLRKKSFDYKKAAKIGLALAVTGLAVYGGYKVYSLSKSGQINLGKTKLGQALSKVGSSSIGSETYENGFKKLSKPETVSEAIPKVNPYFGQDGSKKNCTSCSLAGYLRTTFGYDAKAQYLDDPRKTTDIFSDCVKNYESHLLDGTATKFGRSYEDAESMILRKFKDNGSSGTVTIPLTGGGSHMFNWKIENGKVNFVDYQQRKMNRNDFGKYFNIIDKNGQFFVMRLDNAEIDFEKLSKYIVK